jgi:hypothetical protein
LPSLNAHDRVLAARIGAHALHASGKTNTAAARAAFLDRFERQVDPDGVLPADVRAQRAMHARKGYFTQLALRSARARRRPSGAAG